MERMASVLFNLRKPEPPVPSSLSQLLRMGIRETVALARDPDYYPTSKSWHEPYHGVCHACLSGALMRGVLLCTPAPQSHFRPGTTRNHWHKALWALEYVREGSLFEAHMELFNCRMPRSWWGSEANTRKEIRWHGQKELNIALRQLEKRHEVLVSLEAQAE